MHLQLRSGRPSGPGFALALDAEVVLDLVASPRQPRGTAPPRRSALAAEHPAAQPVPERRVARTCKRPHHGRASIGRTRWRVGSGRPVGGRKRPRKRAPAGAVPSSGPSLNSIGWAPRGPAPTAGLVGSTGDRRPHLPGRVRSPRGRCGRRSPVDPTRPAVGAGPRGAQPMEFREGPELGTAPAGARLRGRFRPPTGRPLPTRHLVRPMEARP